MSLSRRAFLAGLASSAREKSGWYATAVRPRPLLLLSLSACLGNGEVRPQTVVVVDTNLPVVRGAGLAVATMDTLRVDVLSPDGASVRETREYVVGDASAWPFSLGVVGDARVRFRLFASRWAEPTLGPGGATSREPRPEVALDRLVDVRAPPIGKVAIRVLLDGECLGRSADTAAGSTCAGAAALVAPATAALTPDDGSPSRFGTWAALRELPCKTPDDPRLPCVPGGFDVLGDPDLVGLASPREDPAPLRPVVVSPLRMDRHEYTVGRYRALVAGGRAPGAEPSRAGPPGSTLAYCTYLGPLDTRADTMPLNCVPAALAGDLCARDGGRLPTEAEWEHAASGRGEGRPFPWGSVDPECCTASLSRSPDLAIGAACPRAGLEPAGSHRGEGCATGGDVSRDGIEDLGGSLFELTGDTLVAVRTCSGPGVQRDPRCELAGPVLLKSADFTAGQLRARVALRAGGIAGPLGTQGFRCVYPEAP